MAASKEQIEKWVREGTSKLGVTHVLIVCDTYDWEDYPVYVEKGQDVHTQAKYNNGPNMTKLMEVYSLTGKHSLNSQFAEKGLVFHYD